MNKRQALARSAALRALRMRASVHAKPYDIYANGNYDSSH
jgi:hypothetical protein